MSRIIETVTVITPQCTVALPEASVMQHGTSKYVRLAKTDARVSRLLCGRATRLSRPLSSTDVIETLMELRDERFRALCDDTPSCAEDLGLDHAHADPATHRSKRRRSIASSTLPDIVEIEAPSKGTLDALLMNVMLHSPGKPLWVELTTDNLDYIRAWVNMQLSSSSADEPMA